MRLEYLSAGTPTLAKHARSLKDAIEEANPLQASGSGLFNEANQAMALSTVA